jgi:hypothetical protein
MMIREMEISLDTEFDNWLVARLIATAALWVRIQPSLKRQNKNE